MKMGKCIDLTALTPNIVEGGGATATWTAITATHGTLEIHLPDGRLCPGGDPESEIDPYASCTLAFAGCGQLHVTAAGTGGAVDGRPVASSQLLLPDGVSFSAQDAISLVSGSGGLSCESAGLEGADDVTINVTCGMTLTLSFDGLDAGAAPASDVLFDVQIVS